MALCLTASNGDDDFQNKTWEAKDDQELQRSQMFLCGAQYDVEPLLLTGC